MNHMMLDLSTSESFSSCVPEETTSLLQRAELDKISRATTGSPSTTAITRQVLDESRRLLYISHFVNQFSECTWQFCLVLFLAAFSNYESLILVTSYGLVSYSFVCVLGSAAGRLVDGANRLQVAQQFIGFENCSVVLATWLCYTLLCSTEMRQQDREEMAGRPSADPSNDLVAIPTDIQSILLLIGIHLLGAVAALLDSGFTVAIERDWIVVMSQCAAQDETVRETTTTTSCHDDMNPAQKMWLSDTNVGMRQIDLSCKIVAPAVAGFFVAFFDDGSSKDHGYDLRGAALLVGGLNVLALVVEWICTRKIYDRIPNLSFKSPVKMEDQYNSNRADECISRGMETSEKLQSLRSWLKLRVPDGMSVYFSQPICWAGFSLALLYLNVVLTFGGIMTAYLVWRDMSMEAIGIWRGVSSAIGLAGTFVFHFMSKKTDLISIGMVSVLFQFLCLTLCYVSLYIEQQRISLLLLVGGVCLSRIGLWVFDIAVTQLMQEHIPPPIRGLVGGFQQALNAWFTLVPFTIGLFISDPKDFHIYASMGYAGVSLAAVCFACNVYVNRKSLQLRKQPDAMNGT